MNYALIREMDVSNGSGIGVSLFVQGCHFHCDGCCNPETWDFNAGKPWTEEIEDEFMALVSRPYVKRISILGGEPLADRNVVEVCRLIRRLKVEFPEKKVWLYTGYRFEQIKRSAERSPSTEIVNRWIATLTADVLVDGQFEIEKQDNLNKEIVFAGSTNQRVIDIKRTIAADYHVIPHQS